MTRRSRFNRGWILGAHLQSLTLDLLLHQGHSLPPKLLFGLCLLQAPLGLRQVAFVFGKCWFSVIIGVFNSCLTHITGGAGAGDLVLCDAAQDDSSSLVDCLERVCCAMVSALVVYYYLYLRLSSFVRLYTWRNLIAHDKSLMLRSLKVLMLHCERSLQLLARS
jgi:hypothetical protein